MVGKCKQTEPMYESTKINHNKKKLHYIACFATRLIEMSFNMVFVTGKVGRINKACVG